VSTKPLKRRLRNYVKCLNHAATKNPSPKWVAFLQTVIARSVKSLQKRWKKWVAMA
ncbi:TCP-1/cpn60 chaperonin family protein, partial [Vibrio parahaemolyticus V-223/04]